MAVVRRHWKLMVLCLAVLVGGAAWLLLFNTNSQTTAQAQVTLQAEEDKVSTADATAARKTLDEQTYCAVTNLRQQLMLRNEDLAALGCTGASSRVVLEELLGWYEANREKLQQARRMRLASRQAFREAMDQINTGQADEGVVARARYLFSELAQTSQRERDLTRSVIPVIGKKLTEEQCSHWTSVRKQRFMPGVYRYVPDLTAEQKQSVRSAVHTSAYRQMTARTDEQRQQARTAEAEESEALSYSQRTAMEEMKAKMRQNLPEIMQASRNALPAPKQPVWVGPDLESFMKKMQEQQTR